MPESASSLRARRAAAREALGAIDFPGHLPVSLRRSDIARAIAENSVVVVAGATGSGKTTQLPKIALELGRGVAGQIGCTQPRRIAATSVAARVANELGRPPGTVVGCQIRFLGRRDPSTCIKFMTDGILLSEIRRDRLLSNYDTLVIDEAHERGLNVDFILGYLKQILPHRPDLRVAVSSATLDAARFSDFFGGAPVVEVEGRVWPVEVRYRPPADDDDDPDYAEMTRQAVAEILRDEPEGDILCFFPGEADIRDAAEALDRAGLPSRVKILPLYARLSHEEQQRVFDPVPGGRKIVLATNVAETSLTIPGIRAVVDTGRARVRRAAERTGVERLPIERISRASAEQRKGRCGRVGPGICVRLYSEEDFLKRPEYADPEIRRASLAGVILHMKSLGLGELEKFPFIDPPRPALAAEGYRALAELGAIDSDRSLTPIGRNLARLPLEPRFARIALAARAEGVLDEALVVVAMLSVRDPRERPREKRGEADAIHRRWLDARSDFVGFLKLWAEYGAELERLPSKAQARKWCRAHFLNYLRMSEWRDIHSQLAEMLDHEPAPLLPVKDAACPPPLRLNRPPGDSGAEPPFLPPDRYERLHRALLAGLLGRLGKRTDDGDYLGSRGVRFHLWPGSGPAALRKREARAARPLPASDAGGEPLEAAKSAGGGPAWVVCAELTETSRLFGRVVAGIDPAWVERAAGGLAKRAYAQPHYDPRTGFVHALEKVTVHGLAIVENRRVHYGALRPDDARALFIRAALVEGQMRNPPAFVKANLALVEDLKALDHKARRPLWRGEDAVFAFYDECLPAGLHNDRDLRRWVDALAPDAEKALRLAPGQLAEHDPDGLTPDRFPSHLAWRGRRYPLAYKFDPGAADDGVTVTAPAADIPSLPAWRLDWLVPGLLGEKIGHLLRDLPKALRKEFVPIPDTVLAVLREAPPAAKPGDSDAWTAGPFYEWLGRTLGRVAGRRIAGDAPEWKPDALPAHLRMNVRVVDAAGRTLGQSRDLAELRARLSGAAVDMMAALAVDSHERAGLTCWDFGVLAESVELAAPGGGATRAIAFPALADEGGAVALRLRQTPEAARETTRAGLRRLFELACETPLRRLAAQLPFSRDALLAAEAAGYESAALRRDTLRMAIDAVWVGADANAPFPRDARAFARRIEEGRPELVRRAHAAARALDEAWRACARLWPALENPDAARAESYADLRRRLAELLSADTLAWWATPEACLRFPAYAAAAARRRERLAYNVPRDRDRMQTAQPYWERWREAAEAGKAWPYARRRALSAYRWLLEEWRIGLFAQELGTAGPASPKRLDEAWRAVGAER